MTKTSPPPVLTEENHNGHETNVSQKHQHSCQQHPYGNHIIIIIILQLPCKLSPCALPQKGKQVLKPHPQLQPRCEYSETLPRQDQLPAATGRSGPGLG